jgi:C4-dicarboxylate transporter, DctQ subunit
LSINSDRVSPEIAGADKNGLFLRMVKGLILNLPAVLAVICLSVMVLLVLCQIILRNINHPGIPTGIPWADVLVRHLVLWVVFLGAGMATRENRHIHIDLLPRFLPDQIKWISSVAVNVFSVAVLCILCYASYEFVTMEMESGFAPSVAGIPVWVFQTIIPLGYGLIALSFVIQGLSPLFEKRGA